MTTSSDQPTDRGTDQPDADRQDAGQPHRSDSAVRSVRVLGVLVLVAGAVLVLAGGATWVLVQTSLADERITVAEDADRFAGDPVDGPLTAYAEADVIEKHALEATGGKTYAELDREDPARETVMTASFLRSSLFTSVVAFGVAAMAVGLGIVLLLVGWALIAVARALRPLTGPAATAEPSSART